MAFISSVSARTKPSDGWAVAGNNNAVSPLASGTSKPPSLSSGGMLEKLKQSTDRMLQETELAKHEAEVYRKQVAAQGSEISQLRTDIRQERKHVAQLSAILKNHEISEGSMRSKMSIVDTLQKTLMRGMEELRIQTEDVTNYKEEIQGFVATKLSGGTALIEESEKAAKKAAAVARENMHLKLKMDQMSKEYALHEKDVDKLEKTHEQTKAELEACRIETDDLKEKLQHAVSGANAEGTAKSVRIAELADELERAFTKHKEDEDAIKSLQAETLGVKENLQAAQEELKQVAAELTRLEREHALLRQAHEQVQTQMHKQHEDAQVEICHLKQELKHQKAEHDDQMGVYAKRTNQEIISMRAKASSDAQAAVMRAIAAETELNQLHQKLDASSHDNHQKILNLEGERDQAATKIEALEHQLKTLRDDNAVMQSDSSRIQEEAQKLMDKESRMQAMCEQQRNANEALREDIKAANAKVLELQERIENETKLASSAQAAQETHDRELVKENSSLNTQIKREKAANNKLKRDIKKLKDEVSQLQQDADDRIVQNESQIETLKANNHELEDLVARLKVQLHKKAAEAERASARSRQPQLPMIGNTRVAGALSPPRMRRPEPITGRVTKKTKADSSRAQFTRTGRKLSHTVSSMNTISAAVHNREEVGHDAISTPSSGVKAAALDIFGGASANPFAMGA